MNCYFRLHNMLLILSILAIVYAPLNADQISNQTKTDFSYGSDIFPVFCGRFIVLENQVPKLLTDSKKTYEIGFFEQEINRFQAYILATSDHSKMTQYENKYLDRKYTLRDERGQPL